MYTKRSGIACLLILVVVVFATAACNEGVRVGDLQTKSQTIELSDADSVNVEIAMGAGELDIAGGTSDLLQASFTYNVEELDPQAAYAGGRLEVKDNDVREGIRTFFDLDEFRNEWELKLNEDMPMEMRIDLGAGRSNLTLGPLTLTSLVIESGAGDVDVDLSSSRSLRDFDFDMGAGEVNIDMTGVWKNDLDATITGGLGEFTLRLPRDIGVRVDVETGVGKVTATDLSKDGNTYTNDAYGQSGVTLRIDIEGGVGKINLEVE